MCFTLFDIYNKKENVNQLLTDEKFHRPQNSHLNYFSAQSVSSHRLHKVNLRP